MSIIVPLSRLGSFIRGLHL
jgi:hypothetical protein